MLLTDARLGSGANTGRTPLVPVLADYLIDLPRTPWPGPNSDVGSRNNPFVQLHGPVSGGRTTSQAANWNLYYTGSVVTDLTVATNATTAILGLTSLTGISPGQVLYINDEAMQVLSVDPGTTTITVTRGYDGTTATSHSSGDFLQRDDGLGWFFANTHDSQNRIEDFRMTLLGGLINQETQPAFARDILYEDATPRDTGGFQSGLKLELTLDRAPVRGSEIHIDLIVTRTASGNDYEVHYPVELFAADTWLNLDPNQVGGDSAHDMMSMAVGKPNTGGGAITTTQEQDSNIYVGRGSDEFTMVLGHPQWSRYQDVTIRIREVLPNAGTSSQAGGGTGTQQSNVILRRQVIAAPVDLTTNTGTDPSGFVPTEFAFGAVPKTGLLFFDAGVDVAGLFTIGPSVITQGTLQEIGYVENADWDWHLPADRVPCIMLQTELGGSPHEPVIYHPQLRIITEAITAGRPFVLAFFLSAAGSANITGVNFYAWSDQTDEFNLQHSAFTYEAV